jgi:hypothetical protein
MINVTLNVLEQRAVSNDTVQYVEHCGLITVYSNYLK